MPAQQHLTELRLSFRKHCDHASGWHLARAARVKRIATQQQIRLPGIFPNTYGPIVREGADGRELATAIWGMPTPAEHLVTPTGKPMLHDPGVTNIRNTFVEHWKPWLEPEHRCLVPFTSFCEPD